VAAAAVGARLRGVRSPGASGREIVREELHLAAILATYERELRGFPPYHPAMMVALLLYAYSRGIYSSRQIARACEERLDFMAATASSARSRRRGFRRFSLRGFDKVRHDGP
jgi:transposase